MEKKKNGPNEERRFRSRKRIALAEQGKKQDPFRQS